MHSNISTPLPKTAPAIADEISPAQQQISSEVNKIASSPVFIQCKLAIGSPDDPLEQEADTMADTIMRMPEQNIVQRKCSACKDEDDNKIHRKPLASFIQRKESSEGSLASHALSSEINASKGRGSQLDSSPQSFMQNRFGADFSNIKIHTGKEAVQMNRELNAKAFTVGSDIYFNEGRYNPDSNEGKHLLAHELVHTVQQGNGIRSILRKQDFISSGNVKGIKEIYNENDVRNAAWSIVQNEDSVKRAVLFYSQIKKYISNKEDQNSEIARFYDPNGEYHPKIKVKRMEDSGEAKENYGKSPHKELFLSEANTYSVAVSTYLHEMIHYIDIWYNSKAALKAKKGRTPKSDIKSKMSQTAEKKGGIPTFSNEDLDPIDQVTALSEYTTELMKQIFLDMKKFITPKYAHPFAKYLSEEYVKIQAGDNYKNANKEEKEKILLDFEEKEKVYVLNKFDENYKDWGWKSENNVVTNTGVELGYAFEKSAYGFYNENQRSGEWAENFNEKFEKTYGKYLQ